MNKVVLGTLKERSSVAELAQENELSAQQIYRWQREFLLKDKGVFESTGKTKRKAPHRKQLLLQRLKQNKFCPNDGGRLAAKHKIISKKSDPAVRRIS